MISSVRGTNFQDKSVPVRSGRYFDMANSLAELQPLEYAEIWGTTIDSWLAGPFMASRGFNTVHKVLFQNVLTKSLVTGSVHKIDNAEQSRTRTVQPRLVLSFSWDLIAF